MVSIQHANAKTTPRIRQEIQDSNETIAVLAQRLSLNPKTVVKWKNASTVGDKKSGPTTPRSTVLTEQEEQVICEFRRVTRFSLDDVFIALIDNIPTLTRSSLHRCLVRHGLNRLPQEELPAKEKKSFKDYPIGDVHVDISEVHTQEGKAYLFVGIDRASRYTYVEVHTKMTQANACLFLKNFIADCPFIIHTLHTDNGAQFTYKLLAEHLLPKNKVHPFDQACLDAKIEHRLTKFKHPWTNDQVEIMNKVIKAHTVKRYPYETLESLKHHLMSFLLLYNHQRKLKALKYQTPYDKMIEIYQAMDDVDKETFFKSSPDHKNIRLNIYMNFANSLPDDMQCGFEDIHCSLKPDWPASPITTEGAKGRIDITKAFIKQIICSHSVSSQIPEHLLKHFKKCADLREVTSLLRGTLHLVKKQNDTSHILSAYLMCDLILGFFDFAAYDLPPPNYPVPGPSSKFKKCKACWKFFINSDKRQKYCSTHQQYRNFRNINLRKLATKNSSIKIKGFKPLPELESKKGLINPVVQVERQVRHALIELDMLDVGADLYECSKFITNELLLSDGQQFSQAFRAYAILNSPYKHKRKRKINTIEAKEMLEKNINISEIARHFKVSRQAIDQALRKTLSN